MQNPITYTEKVVSDFLKYQLSTYAFADTGLHAQLRQLLSLEETRNTSLLKGPYISLSRAFRQGASYADLAAQGVLPMVTRKKPTGPSRTARARWWPRAPARARPSVF